MEPWEASGQKIQRVARGRRAPQVRQRAQLQTGNLPPGEVETEALTVLRKPQIGDELRTRVSLPGLQAGVDGFLWDASAETCEYPRYLLQKRAELVLLDAPSPHSAMEGVRHG